MTNTSAANSDAKPQLYACLRYADADRAIELLNALGFTESLVVRDEQDPSIVHHAQFRWRDNGGIMFGSKRADDKGVQTSLNRIAACCNIVVPSDADVDRVLEAARPFGEVTQEPHHPDHGGRSALLVDFEGNLWNIDSYPGE